MKPHNEMIPQLMKIWIKIIKHQLRNSRSETMILWSEAAVGFHEADDQSLIFRRENNPNFILINRLKSWFVTQRNKRSFSFVWTSVLDVLLRDEMNLQWKSFIHLKVCYHEKDQIFALKSPLMSGIISSKAVWTEGGAADGPPSHLEILTSVSSFFNPPAHIKLGDL